MANVENQLIMGAMERTSAGNQPLTQKEVNKIRTIMAKGNYPPDISDCNVIGISGGCGENCIVLNRGECLYVDEGLADGKISLKLAIDEIDYDIPREQMDAIYQYIKKGFNNA